MDNDPEPVETQRKEKPLNELLTSTVVDIYVGPDSTHWPLHERLLCYHSPFFANIFYKDYDKSHDSDNKNKSSSRKSYGLSDEENETFTLLVGWLYSRVVPPPKIEKDIGPLLDLYLLAQKLEIEALSTDVVNATREFYHTSSTYPGLRRVQYIYGNTDEDNEMREMMVSSVARQLATTEKIPMHWASALQRNGQLAVDIIRAIQRWHIEENSIPDIRDGSISRSRGRTGKGGFSAIKRDGESIETDTSGAMTGSVSLGSNLGVESVASDELGADQDKSYHDQSNNDGATTSASQQNKADVHESRLVIEGEAPYYYLSLVRTQRRNPSILAADPPSSSQISSPATIPSTSSSPLIPQPSLKPSTTNTTTASQDDDLQPRAESNLRPRIRRRRPSVTFSDEVDFLPAPPPQSSSPSPSPQPPSTTTSIQATSNVDLQTQMAERLSKSPDELNDTITNTKTDANPIERTREPTRPQINHDHDHEHDINPHPNSRQETDRAEKATRGYRWETYLLLILWIMYLWAGWFWYST